MELDFDSDIQVPALALQLMQAAHNDTNWTTNQLLEGLWRSIDERKGELMLIRDRITDLLSSKYMPNPAYIMKALYPSWEDIQEAAELMRREREAMQ